eukprot:m.164755 g.164755  ORF g.164755 m.164755 type:complete len:59 (+) comp38886_c2_seq13:839-1015(+)
MQGRMEKAIFVPEVYTRTQSDWISSFFKQNGYIGGCAPSSLLAFACHLSMVYPQSMTP